MHVPSTTYLGRGIYHLALTDADFLYKQKLIDEKEATSIVLYCFAEFLEDVCDLNDMDKVIPLSKLSEFSDYAETRYAPKARAILFKQNLRTLREVYNKLKTLPDFFELSRKWYKYLKDNYCKISVFNDNVEFRISSDGFDWNKVIVDDVILKHDTGKPYTTKYTIMKESENGYQEYFSNATLEDILHSDKTILSSKLLERRVINKRLKYFPKSE